MSDVLIKGMGMPKDNDYLLLIIQNGKVHKAISCGHLTTDEMNVAKAVELPPHGRLIDADVLKGSLSRVPSKGIRTYFFAEVGQFIDEAPTILEANCQQITSKLPASYRQVRDRMSEMRNDIEAVEAQKKIKLVFDKVVAYKCRQFRSDYPKSSIGRKVIRQQTVHICHVLFPEIYESLLIETITHYIGTLEATE